MSSGRSETHTPRRNTVVVSEAEVALPIAESVGQDRARSLRRCAVVENLPRHRRLEAPRPPAHRVDQLRRRDVSEVAARRRQRAVAQLRLDQVHRLAFERYVTADRVLSAILDLTRSSPARAGNVSRIPQTPTGVAQMRSSIISTAKARLILSPPLSGQRAGPPGGARPGRPRGQPAAPGARAPSRRRP